MELNDKVTQLEDEIKILKNEVQAVLLDLRESYLSNKNPFTLKRQPITVAPVTEGDITSVAYEQAPEAGEETIAESAPVQQQEVMPPEQVAVEEELPDSVPEETPEIIPDDIPEEEATAGPETAGDTLELSEEESEIPVMTEPVFPIEPDTPDNTAREEVTGARHVNAEMIARFVPEEPEKPDEERWDLATIDKLAQWMDEAVVQLGHEQTRKVLEISETMGYINTNLKNILVRFICPVQEEQLPVITTNQYLTLLIELNNLLGRDNRTESAILYMLCQENDNR